MNRNKALCFRQLIQRILREHSYLPNQQEKATQDHIETTRGTQPVGNRVSAASHRSRLRF